MRKVLSYVLILALVLSSFSMAFAGSATELKTLSDVAGNANEEAIGVVYDLGIVTGNPDGTFQPTKAVTRAEFAAMITRALAIPESALAGYAKTNFKDTTGYTWAVPYLAFCNSKGIMLGDGQGNAMPGKTITVNEAVTMVLRALGYTNNSSELVGTWPSNYVTKAQELKLYDDVAKDLVGVDKANAAQIIYNALTVQKVAVNTDGETKKLWDVEPNAAGVGGTPTTLLSSGLNCDATSYVTIDNGQYADSLINMAKHIGEYGTVYTNDDDEIVAFIADSDVLVGRFTAANKFVTTDEEKEYTISLGNRIENKVAVDFTAAGNDRIQYLVNGENTGSYDDVAAMVTAKDGGSYGYLNGSKEYALHVDLSGKTIKDIYSAVEWTVVTADQVSKSDIDTIKDDHEFLGYDFVEEDNDEIDYTQFALVGISKLSDVKADDVVYIYTGANNKIRKIEVGTKTVEGVVKSYKAAKTDVAVKFTIGAETLKNAGQVINGAANFATDVTTDEVSEEVKVVLDARGYVYDFSNLTSASNFAVIEKADVEATAIDPRAKLLLSDGTEKSFSYDIEEKDEARILAGGPANITDLNPAEKSIMGYALDKDGVVTEANLFAVVADSIKLGNKGTIKTINGAAAAPGSAVTAAGAGITNAKIASDCVVFTYDYNGVADDANYTNATDWDVSSLDKIDIDKFIGAVVDGNGNITTDNNASVVLLFKEDHSYKLANGTKPGYDPTKVVAMLVPEASAKSGDKHYAVLNDLYTETNDDGDKVYRVVGYVDGTKLDALTSDRKYFQAAAPSLTDYENAGTIQLFEVRVDAKGVVTSVGNGDAPLAADVDGVVQSADSRTSVVVGGNRHAISEKAVIYRVDGDEYKVETGKIKDTDSVQLFETDDDEDGFDVVIIYNRP